MKIIHCSDLHLDADLKTNFDAASAAGRRAELLDTFRRLCRTARDEKVTAILICGDLFDTGSPSPSAVRFVEDLILTYGEICFFYLRGNHDARSALFENRTKPDNLFYFGSTWTHWELPPGRQGGRPVCITGMEPGSASFTPPLLDHRSLNIVMLHALLQAAASIIWRSATSIITARLLWTQGVPPHTADALKGEDSMSAGNAVTFSYRSIRRVRASLPVSSLSPRADSTALLAMSRAL